MKQNLWGVALILLAPFLLSTLLLSGLSSSLVHAQEIIYVDAATCPATGAGTREEPFCRIQDGVDTAVAGDEIRVAGGTYTGVQEIVGSTGYTFTQVVFVDKSLTLRGGYDGSNWDASPNIEEYPTVIDAQRHGRPLSIVGPYNNVPAVSVEGFTLTGGDYTGLGNEPGTSYQGCSGTGIDCGGGLLAFYTQLTLRHLLIFDNVASRNDSGRVSQGGGMYLWELQPGSIVEYTTVFSNSASFYGGGLYVQHGSDLTIRHTTISENAVFSSGGAGGGLYIFQPGGSVTIERSDILRNQSYIAGGIDARLTYAGEALRMDRVRLLGNEVTADGTAVQITKQGGGNTSAHLTNLLFAENRAEHDADFVSVIGVTGGSAGSLNTTLAHVTAANNQVPSFLFVETYADYPVTAVLTNTLVVSFTNAFVGSEIAGDRPLFITHTNTLTDNVALLHTVWAGTPAFSAVSPLSGDSLLDASYRLQPGSAAIDAGVDAGVSLDIDGEPRPYGLAPDIGADEYYVYKIYLPTVLR